MQNKQLQLFILPYAGGSIEAFRRLSDLIDPQVEVITVEYSGRGTRAREPLAASLDELMNDAISYAVSRRNKKISYAILGYSMGGILAYEFLKRDVLTGTLCHTFICAEMSPKERALEFSRVDYPTDELILDRARKLGGINERLIDNKRFFNIFIQPMLSDYRLLYSYKFQPRDNQKIKSNVTFFYSENDTPYQSLTSWEDLIEGTFDYFQYGENHFFVNQHYEEMANVINSHLYSFLRE